MRAGFAGDRSDAGEHHGIWAGFRFLVREPVLRRLSVAWIVLVLGIGMAMVADVPLTDLFDAGSAGFGLMIGLWGAGSVLGSLSAGRWLTPRPSCDGSCSGPRPSPCVGVAIALSPWFALVLALNIAWGIGEGLTSVAEENILQRRTPDSVRSRVLGAVEGLFHGGLAVSYIAAAFVLPVVGARGMYAILAVTAALAAIVIAPILRVDRPETSPGAEAETPVLHAPVIPGDPGA